MSGVQRAVLGALLDRYGQTYALEAKIRLKDSPGPLYQLLVLATLLSARIPAEVAVAAARELFTAGCRTPTAMSTASWQDRVDALDRGRYRRYDERTATMLGTGAELLITRWSGDLRNLRDEADGDAVRIGTMLTEFPGIGRVGADIFLREVQVIWPSVYPYLDSRVLDEAARLGLPDHAGELAELAGSPDQLTCLAAALVRVSLNRRGADDVLAAAGAGRLAGCVLLGARPLARH